MRNLIFGLLSILVTSASAETCGPVPSQDPVFRVENQCGPDGVLHSKRFIFRSSGTLGRLYEYSKGQVVRLKVWSLDQELSGEFRYHHEPNGTWIQERLDLKTGRVVSRARSSGSIENDEDQILLREWTLDAAGRAIDVNSFIPGTRRVKLRQSLNSRGEVVEQYEIEFVSKPATSPYVQRVRFLDASGRETGRFEKGRNFLVRAPLPHREPVLIIDSGFDLTHPELRSKVWQNPLDPIDGHDNDGNGWADDFHGWNIASRNNDISDNLLLPRTGAPFSHGTHVASLALAGIKKFSFIGYAGNMAHPLLLHRAAESIRKFGVRFVNMSFGWEADGGAGSPFSPGDESSSALEMLIRGSPKTLFVVAAGNSGQELIRFKTCEYPPCLTYPNMLTVGALNIAAANVSSMESARPAEFSNFSTEFVDIFAAGEDVMGAGLGGSQLPLPGTSMASPIALNSLLRMSEIAPDFEPMLLKEILLKSAYIQNIETPLPARSGGQVYLERALRVTELKKQDLEASVEDLVLRARGEGFRLKGEQMDAVSIGKLRDLWRARLSL